MSASMLSLVAAPGGEFAGEFLRAFREGRPVAVLDPAEAGRDPGLPPAPGTAVRLWTSGTTGEPRAVDLTRANFEASAAGTAAVLRGAAADRWLCCLPLHHVAGLSIVTRAELWGAGVVVHERFETDRVAAALAAEGITLVSLVATQLARLLDAGADLTGPRAIVLGGGPVPVELLDRALARGARVVQSYGMTETCSQVALLAPEDAGRKRGSAGRALPGAEIEIRDGEIHVRGAMVAPSAAGADGWLATGDLGRLDDEGYLWVEGRADDMIVTGGENVDPEVVERALLEHPGVADVAVVGRADPEWGRAVTAVVVAAAGHAPDPEELQEHCRERLARHEVPKSFELTTELPRTPGGKLRRATLR